MYYKKYFKRLMDLILSIIFIIVLLPLIISIIFILIPLNKGEIFYKQLRIGLNCKPFKLIKLKTMNDKRDEFGQLLPDNFRITKFGHFIRSLSLDELPQLYNVLKGDMSLVGPRPLLQEYLPLYNARQARRHEVRPGITGWAQVNGRNLISWEQKFEYDVWYIDNMSFILDVKILCLTIIKILKREGINSSQNETMKPFRGNEKVC